VKKTKKFTIYRDRGDAYDDMYEISSFPSHKGKIVAFGKAKFYEGTLPSDFVAYNPSTLAGSLRSTATKPPFWDDTGTDHSVNVEFDCTKTPNTDRIDPVAGGVKPPIIR
jgi:hypothetical protein